jgi:hypothetical protein
MSFGRSEMYTGYWLGHVKERDHWEDLDVDNRIILTGSLKCRMRRSGLDESC